MGFLRPRDEDNERQRMPARRRSVYENRDIVVLDDDVDDDTPEPGWTRVGTFDPVRGAWIGGPPRWPGG